MLKTLEKMLPFRPASLLLPGVFISLLLLFPPLNGCGDDDDGGITLEAQYVIDGTGVSETPGNIYPDGFLTPSKIRVGIKAAHLIRSNETTPSNTIFDTEDPAKPIRLDLLDTPQFVESSGFLLGNCPCLFSKLQLEISFIDITVPTYTSGVVTDRRFRFYTQDINDSLLPHPVEAGDLLIGNASEKFNFQWIDLADGDFLPLSDTRPAVPLLKVPPARFPDNTYSNIVTVDLEPFLDIPEDIEDTTFKVTATFQIKELFFYDETDTAAPEKDRFDLSSDGNLEANDPDSFYSSTFPVITAAPN